VGKVPLGSSSAGFEVTEKMADNEYQLILKTPYKDELTGALRSFHLEAESKASKEMWLQRIDQVIKR